MCCAGMLVLRCAGLERTGVVSRTLGFVVVGSCIVEPACFACPAVLYLRCSLGLNVLHCGFFCCAVLLLCCVTEAVFCCFCCASGRGHQSRHGGTESSGRSAGLSAAQ